MKLQRHLGILAHFQVRRIRLTTRKMRNKEKLEQVAIQSNRNLL
jgi:hypothetical protein